MNSFKEQLKNKSTKSSSSKKGCMLNFPGSSAIMGFEDDFDFDVSTSNKAKQRNSICLSNVNLAGLSDYDSDNGTLPSKQPPKRSSSKVSNSNASGGPEHRPLVGGFAAAAYEAARVDYYKKKGMKVNGHDSFPSDQKTRPKVMLRSGNLPRYP
jgi:hypothetical protein